MKKKLCAFCFFSNVCVCFLYQLLSQEPCLALCSRVYTDARVHTHMDTRGVMTCHNGGVVDDEARMTAELQAAMLADDGDGDAIMYVQRRLFPTADAAAATTSTGAGRRPGGPDADNNGLLGILFQPIAGDAGGSATSPAGEGLAVRCLQFSILDAESVSQMAAAVVTNPSTAEVPGCLSDLRMGASSVTNRPCQSCGASHHNCPGHFGCIRLPHPVLNPLFVSLVTTVLQTVCVRCHRLRLSPYFIQSMFPLPAVRAGALRLLQRLKSIAMLCARQTRCQFCRAELLVFKQQGLVVLASRRPTQMAAAAAAATQPQQQPPPSDPASPVSAAASKAFSRSPPIIGASPVVVPTTHIFSILVQMPDIDIHALGFVGFSNHPCGVDGSCLFFFFSPSVRSLSDPPPVLVRSGPCHRQCGDALRSGAATRQPAVHAHPRPPFRFE